MQLGRRSFATSPSGAILFSCDVREIRDNERIEMLVAADDDAVRSGER